MSRRSSHHHKQETSGWRSKIGPEMFSMLLLLFVAAISGGFITVTLYMDYVNPERVYGEWTEIGAPSWSTDSFTLSTRGVMSNNRYLTSSFQFDGSIVSFQSGGKLHEYQLFGHNDQRLKRISGEGHAASFIKKGYEHTLPKEEEIGPANRVSVAEYFSSK